MKTTTLIALIAGMALSVSHASAAFITFDNRADFVAALGSTLIDDNVNQFSGLELDFENSSVNTVTPGPTLGGFDVSHSGDESITQFVDGNNLNTGAIGSTPVTIQLIIDQNGAPGLFGNTNNLSDTGSISITTPGITAFGFDTFILNDGGSGALLGPEDGADFIVNAGAMSQTFTPAANQPFFGVISTGDDLTSIDLVITSGAAAGGFEIIAMDNFIGGTAIPEPTSLALLGLGSLALIRRRRRAVITA